MCWKTEAHYPKGTNPARATSAVVLVWSSLRTIQLNLRGLLLCREILRRPIFNVIISVASLATYLRFYWHMTHSQRECLQSYVLVQWHLKVPAGTSHSKLGCQHPASSKLWINALKGTCHTIRIRSMFPLHWKSSLCYRLACAVKVVLCACLSTTHQANVSPFSSVAKKITTYHNIQNPCGHGWNVQRFPSPDALL